MLFSGRVFRIVLAVGFSISSASCVQRDTAGHVSGFKMGDVNIIADSPYLDRDFLMYVSPHIADVQAFSDLNYKIKITKNLSGKDAIDAIIGLGILKYAPQWIRPEVKDQIYQIYPELKTRHAWLNNTKVILAMNDYQTVMSDVTPEYASAQVVTVVFSVVGSVMLAQILKTMSNTNVNLNPFLTHMLTPSAMEEINNSSISSSQENVSQQTSAPDSNEQKKVIVDSAPEVVSNAGKCSEDDEKKLNAWYHPICDAIKKKRMQEKCVNI